MDLENPIKFGVFLRWDSPGKSAGPFRPGLVEIILEQEKELAVLRAHDLKRGDKIIANMLVKDLKLLPSYVPRGIDITSFPFNDGDIYLKFKSNAELRRFYEILNDLQAQMPILENSFSQLSVSGSTKIGNNEKMEEISVKIYSADGGNTRRFPFNVPKQGSGAEMYDEIFNRLLDKVKIVLAVDAEKRVELAWKDEDGDSIVMNSDMEVKEALRHRQGDIFRIFVRQNNITSMENGTSTETIAAPPPAQVISVFIGDDLEAVDMTPPQQPDTKPKPEEKAVDEPRVHEHVICDGCNQQGIRGIRYKCLVCPDYDLCGDCEGKRIHDEHPMIRIPAAHDRSWVPAFMAAQRRCMGFVPRLHHGGHHGAHPGRFFPQYYGPRAANGGQQPEQQPQQEPQQQPGMQFLRDVGQAVAAVLNGLGIDVDVDVEHDGQRRKVATPRSAAEQENAQQQKPEEKAEKQAHEVVTIMDEPIAENVISPMTPASPDQMDTGNTDGQQDYVIVDNNEAVSPMNPFAPTPMATASASGQPVTDPRIAAALTYMLSMGFTNEGGWLTQLLEAKDGDIAAVLDILHPSLVKM